MPWLGKAPRGGTIIARTVLPLSTCHRSGDSYQNHDTSKLCVVLLLLYTFVQLAV